MAVAAVTAAPVATSEHSLQVKRQAVADVSDDNVRSDDTKTTSSGDSTTSKELSGSSLCKGTPKIIAAKAGEILPVATASCDEGSSGENPKPAVIKETKKTIKEEKKSKKADKQMKASKSKKIKHQEASTADNEKHRKNKVTDSQKKPVTPGGHVSQSNAEQSSLKETIATKPKLLVEELKLFQNNHLLNQQDPLEQLHQQLNGLIGDDDIGRRSRNLPLHFSSSSSKPFPSGQIAAVASIGDGHLPMSSQQQRYLTSCHDLQPGSSEDKNNSIIYDYDGAENIFTVKKGVLWQQQNYEKFHQRLFSRWKKRYFILTTDYLVCFKRSASKVGRSEMGKFLYKTALSDVTKICWSKPAKSDRGAIVLYTNGPFNLFLWSKKNRDEWMFMINESIERIKLRRSCIVKNGAQKVVSKCGNNISSPINGCDTILENRDQAHLETVVANGLLASKPSTANNIFPSSSDQDIGRATNGNNHSPMPLEAIIKLRSHQQNSASEVNDNQEFTPNDKCNGDPTSYRHKSNSGSRIKSSPLSANNNTNSSSESERAAHLVDREHQLPRSKDNDDLDDDDQRHKKQTGAHEDSAIRASGRGRRPMIYDPATNIDSRLSQCGRDNLAKIGGSKTDDGQKFRSTAHQAATNDLSSDLDRSVAIGGCDANGLSTVDGENCNHSPANAIDLVSQRNLVKSSSGNRRWSGEQRLKAKASEESAEEEPCNSVNGRCDGNITKRKTRSPDKMEHKSLAACDTENAQGAMQPVPTDKTGRQPSNLIRRDDSWQSLVSLTHVGKVTPVSAQAVAQRSLYAQHIMPEGNNATSRGGQQQQYQKQLRQHNRPHMIIESSVTPSRAPFIRQQSIQIDFSQRKLRPLPPLRQQAASFDAAPNSSVQVDHQRQQQRSKLQQQAQFQQQLLQSTTSYHQKLLQLQLLHNSNNVDYIRHNGGEGSSANDYGQIYWPESSANHYGYSSMRSNLKSAASEFSFIRPSPSSHGQSTLPHHQNHLPLASRLLDNQQQPSTAREQPIMSSLILTNKNSNDPQKEQQSDSNNNNIRLMSPQQIQQQQYLVNPLTGERLMVNQKADAIKEPMTELAPPMRDLPLKPNKKRLAPASDGSSLPKSSSLTSSIASFFRRAFSRRSKRKRRSKLAESCSSSLGAFEDGFSNVPMVPSAFSTGSKSVGGRKNIEESNVAGETNNAPIIQSQRMVAMIEAFTSKTQAAADLEVAEVTQIDSIHQQYPTGAFKIDSNVTPKLAGQSQQLLKSAVLNQFGSPLHKSNSISATMGLSGLVDANGRRAYMYDNEMLNGPGIGVKSGAGGSPMLLRSNKVMSANLTPLMSRRDPTAELFEIENSPQNQQQQQQFFLSPRNSRPDQLPRPSSIYGQPSMISSPMITREDRANNFGLHRNSLHNQHHFRDNHQNPSSSSKFDPRRHHQMMKMHPFQLDTTREVAEEISSPITESRDHHDYIVAAAASVDQANQLGQSARSNVGTEQNPFGRYPGIAQDSFDDIISASPSSSKLYRYNSQQRSQQRAVVNPIFQSPTMDTIYDNHPMLNGPELTPLASYSHYDNHNQLLLKDKMDHHRQSPSLNHQAKVGPPLSPAAAILRASENPYSAHRMNSSSSNAVQHSYTPLHHQQQRLSESVERSDQMILINKKPSAIVAPSTPNRNSNNFTANDLGNSMTSSPTTDIYQRNLHHHPQLTSISPMLSRRMVNSQSSSSNYQQSPLVSSQTRIINKGDRVQATIIGDGGVNSTRALVGPQPVVNIAGAPGINLEPSLAASLLRGTNINAYESSTFDRLTASTSNKASSKTFLVSTRLSKSMAYNQCLSNNDNDSTSSSVAKDESTATVRSSKEELSSSGSVSINSINGKDSLRRTRKATPNLGDF